MYVPANPEETGNEVGGELVDVIVEGEDVDLEVCAMDVTAS